MATDDSTRPDARLGEAPRDAADAATTRAHAPYSGLHVGAAGLSADGEVVTGCNVENASLGLTLCAECGLVSALVSGGHGRLVAVSVVAGDGQPLAPCGRCSQVLLEHGGAELALGRRSRPRPGQLAAAAARRLRRRRARRTHGTRVSSALDAVEVIRTKRDDGVLERRRDRVGHRRLHQGGVADEQMAALLMAVL